MTAPAAKPAWRKRLPLIAGVLVSVVVGVAGVILVSRFMASPAPVPKKVVQQVRLIRPPPPPPEPEIEKPPEPEIEEKVDLPEPEPTPEQPSDEPPPGELLGLDAEGVAGGDGFGLVSRPGGRNLLGSGGDRFAWYAGMLKDDLLSFLAEHRDIRSRAYSVSVRLWLDREGAITRVALTGSTGDRDLDRELETLLGAMKRVGQSPPDDLPQPVQIRIVSRL